MTSTRFFIIIICICLTCVTSYPLETNELPLETDYDLIGRNVVKKDIFMSRGWGAAGMPYSMYYLDKPLSYQQRHKNNRNPTKADSKALYVKQENEEERSGNEMMNNYEALRSPSAEDSTQNTVKNGVRNEKLRKLSSPPKNKYTIPQLFISYGWGPMG